MKLFSFQISLFLAESHSCCPHSYLSLLIFISSHLITAKSEKTWDLNWRHFSPEKIRISSCSETHTFSPFRGPGWIQESQAQLFYLLTQALTPWAFRWRQWWKHLFSEHSWTSGVCTAYYSILAHHLFFPLCIFSSLLVSSKTQRKCFKLILNVL